MENIRPFPRSKKSHFQNEAKYEAIDMKMIFNYDANKTHFHNKGFALSLVLKVRCFGTRKWPIQFKEAGQAEASLLCLLKSPFGEVTIKYVCIVVERHSLVNLST